MSTLLEVRQLSVQIEHQWICQNLNWRVSSGESWAILGKNGVGKSTLLRVLAGLERPHQGEIRLAGCPLTAWNPPELAQRRAWLPQAENYAFTLSVLEYVLLSRYPYQQSGHWRRWLAEQDLALARRYLACFGLDTFTHRDLRSLSGGEQRRVALAAVLAQQTPLLFLDEPLSQLDWHYQSQVFTVIHETTLENSPQEPTAIVWTTHDLPWLSHHSTHLLLLLGEGKFLLGPTPELLTAENLSALYQTPILAVDTEHGPVFLPKRV